MAEHSAPSKHEVEQTILALARESAENAVLLTVAYADIFDAPISAEALHRFLIGRPMSQTDIAETVARCQLEQDATTYALPNRQHLFALADRRQTQAARMWPKARRYGGLLGQLPFVRMVAVTGSLAVDNPTRAADIDYFVVTAPDRLWLARLFILIVGRLARRDGIEICPNYIITERQMVLADRGLYEARELVQMVPLSGHDVYRTLMAANEWLVDFLPNARTIPIGMDVPRSPWQRAAESVLRGRIGDWLERWERERKVARLSDGVISAESNYTADVCKGHQHAHRMRTLHELRRRIDSIPALRHAAKSPT